MDAANPMGWLIELAKIGGMGLAVLLAFILWRVIEKVLDNRQRETHMGDNDRRSDDHDVAVALDRVDRNQAELRGDMKDGHDRLENGLIKLTDAVTEGSRQHAITNQHFETMLNLNGWGSHGMPPQPRSAPDGQNLAIG